MPIKFRCTSSCPRILLTPLVGKFYSHLYNFLPENMVYNNHFFIIIMSISPSSTCNGSTTTLGRTPPANFFISKKINHFLCISSVRIILYILNTTFLFFIDSYDYVCIAAFHVICHTNNIMQQICLFFF